MSNELDARGLLCPQPVILTKRALDAMSAGVLTVRVDNAIAKENVRKLATSLGCAVDVAAQAGGFALRLTKGEATEAPTFLGECVSCREEASAEAGLVYLITKDTLGHGSDELGAVLMRSFLHTLLEGPMPKALLFLNSGVKLTVETSALLEPIRAMAEAGCQVLSCGTCLSYYHLEDKLAVGEATNMYTILELARSARTLTL